MFNGTFGMMDNWAGWDSGYVMLTIDSILLDMFRSNIGTLFAENELKSHFLQLSRSCILQLLQ